MTDRAREIEQFVLAKTGGVLLPIPVKKVCEMLLTWDRDFGPEIITAERRCPSCNYRMSGDSNTVCPVDGSQMTAVTWREACLAATRIASNARSRVELLESAWPESAGIPVGHEIDGLSIEDKIERLQEQGLYRIEFVPAWEGQPQGVRLLFLVRPGSLDINEPRAPLPVVYPSFDEAVHAEWARRQ